MYSSLYGKITFLSVWRVWGLDKREVMYKFFQLRVGIHVKKYFILMYVIVYELLFLICNSKLTFFVRSPA